MCLDRRRDKAQTPALNAAAARQRPQSTASPSSVPIGADIPFPQGCNSAYATPDRATTCTHEFQTWQAIDVETKTIVGTQQLELWEVWVAAASSLTIQHGLQVATRAATGVFVTGRGATVSISNPCVGGRLLTHEASCTATEQFPSIDPVFVQPNTFMGNQWAETFDLGPNSRITPSTVPGSTLLMLVTPTAPPSPVLGAPAYLVTDNAWRCDVEVLGAGCVGPLYAPTVVFNTALTPKVRPAALHMRDAQNQLSQHWGKLGSGHPLHRITDTAQRDRNNAAACASFVSNPPVAIECDEYPFASTREGGAGASIRAVSAEANRSQGGVLLGGYNSARILDGDAYYVQVIIDDSATEKVMIVGDSISQGLDGDYTWRYRLWQHFQSVGVPDAFVGPRSGTHDLYSGTTEGGGTRVGGWENNHDALWGRAALDERNVIQGLTATYQPDVILVELGINDLVWLSTPQGTRDSMSALITNARNANPNAKFVIGNVMERAPLAGWPQIPGNIATYNSLLASLVTSISTAQSPVALADLHAVLNPATDTYDGLHPNEIGEYKIAAAFSNTLASAHGIGQSFGAIPASVPQLAMTTPTLTVTPNGGGAMLSWTRSYGANGYWVYVRNLSAGETKLSRLPLPIGDDHWQAGALSDGQVLQYAVQARRSDTNVSAVSAAVQVTVHPKTPVQTTSTTSTSCVSCARISTSWAPISTAIRYDVSWVDTTAAPNALLSATTTIASYTIPAVVGHKYVIAVSGVNEYGAGVASGIPAIYAGRGAPVANTLTTATATGGWDAHLVWTSVAGAAAYRIWTRNWATNSIWTALLYPVDGLTFDPGLIVDGATNHEFKIQPLNGSMPGPFSNTLRVR